MDAGAVMGMLAHVQESTATSVEEEHSLLTDATLRGIQETRDPCTSRFCYIIFIGGK